MQSPADILDSAEPFRFYYPDESVRGKIPPQLMIGAEWHETIPNTRGERVSPEAVIAVMQALNLDFLSDIAGPLAWVLQVMKQTRPFRFVPPADFKNPVMLLRRAIPNLIPAAAQTNVYLEAAIAEAEPGCADRARRETLHDALTQFILASQAIMELSSDTGGSKSTADWHDDAYFLAIKIIEEGKRQGRQIPLSKYNSSGIMLIERLLHELALVNQSGANAIAKELNRKRQSEPFLRL